jgi:hypothetical protein
MKVAPANSGASIEKQRLYVIIVWLSIMNNGKSIVLTNEDIVGGNMYECKMGKARRKSRSLNSRG